jgi:hypothetical protein
MLYGAKSEGVWMMVMMDFAFGGEVGYVGGYDGGASLRLEDLG